MPRDLVRFNAQTPRGAFVPGWEQWLIAEFVVWSQRMLIAFQKDKHHGNGQQQRGY